MSESWVVYDGAEGDISYCETEGEAVERLKTIVADSLDDGEWMYGVESSFVAHITHRTKEIKLPKTEAQKEENLPADIDFIVEEEKT